MSQPIEHFYCQNSGCPADGLRDHGNLRVEGLSGHKKEIRMIRCKTCMSRFSERKGTVLEHCRLPYDKEKGDQWDHTAIDAESRLIISAVAGRRTLASCVTLVQAVKAKTEGRTDLLLASDNVSDTR